MNNPTVQNEVTSGYRLIAKGMQESKTFSKRHSNGLNVRTRAKAIKERKLRHLDLMSKQDLLKLSGNRRLSFKKEIPPSQLKPSVDS